MALPKQAELLLEMFIFKRQRTASECSWFPLFALICVQLISCCFSCFADDCTGALDRKYDPSDIVSFNLGFLQGPTPHVETAYVRRGKFWIGGGVKAVQVSVGSNLPPPINLVSSDVRVQGTKDGNLYKGIVISGPLNLVLKQILKLRLDEYNNIATHSSDGGLALHAYCMELFKDMQAFSKQFPLRENAKLDAQSTKALSIIFQWQPAWAATGYSDPRWYPADFNDESLWKDLVQPTPQSKP